MIAAGFVHQAIELLSVIHDIASQLVDSIDMDSNSCYLMHLVEILS